MELVKRQGLFSVHLIMPCMALCGTPCNREPDAFLHTSHQEERAALSGLCGFVSPALLVGSSGVILLVFLVKILGDKQNKTGKQEKKGVPVCK